MMMHIFIQWLAHKQALDGWLEGVVTTTDYGQKESMMIDKSERLASEPHTPLLWLIDSSFAWRETLEGQNYWEDLQDQWRLFFRSHQEYFTEVEAKWKQLEEEK